VIVGIETGGTKVVCGAFSPEEPAVPLDVRRFPTTSPSETIGRINEYLSEVGDRQPIEALGIASFGPLNVSRDEPRYGWITGTVKPGWANTKLLERIPVAEAVPTALLSDVSGAATAEHRWGAGAGVASIGYATVGTGVGVGLVLNGRLFHGNGFPELGHLMIRRHPLDDFVGSCPFHGDCLEGLVSGPAVLARWGVDSSSLPDRIRSRAHEILGFYIAQLAATVAYTSGVDRIVIGGGVLKAPGLLDETRQQFPLVTGGPHAGHAITADAFDFLVPPLLGDASGMLGASAAALDLLLARRGASAL
jgi:fructokinase